MGLKSQDNDCQAAEGEREDTILLPVSAAPEGHPTAQAFLFLGLEKQ
jgi:hypothetical protein